MDRLQQWSDLGVFWDVCSCILNQWQGFDGAQGKICQEQVVIVQSQNNKGPEWPLWREMTEACWCCKRTTSRFHGWSDVCSRCSPRRIWCEDTIPGIYSSSFWDSVLDDKLPELLRYELKLAECGKEWRSYHHHSCNMKSCIKIHTQQVKRENEKGKHWDLVRLWKYLTLGLHESDVTWYDHCSR